MSDEPGNPPVPLTPICPLSFASPRSTCPCLGKDCAWWIKYKEPIKERDNITGECAVSVLAIGSNYIAGVIQKFTSKGIMLPR
jgi:hypothetical protein